MGYEYLILLAFMFTAVVVVIGINLVVKRIFDNKDKQYSVKRFAKKEKVDFEVHP